MMATNYSFSTSKAPQEATTYTVSQLNRATRSLLTDQFGSIWVEGEISNLARPASGHLYFTLKDPGAQIRCALFRTHKRRLQFDPNSGDQVVVKAQVSLYEPRGDYQLIVERMIDAGDGALRRAFEALKQRLQQEGLFDAELKRPIPPLPQRIGVITSASGAAIHDILTVLKRRFPAIEVMIYPATVQGDEAIESIVQALGKATQRNECDLLIVARGGGSLEDLWAFNEERVVRAMAACTLPIITGIGHEVDFTIADYVADLRAATPSAAAEAATPDQAEWLARLASHLHRLNQCMTRQLDQHRQSIDWLERQLGQLDPSRQLQLRGERLAGLEQRLHHAITARITSATTQLNSATNHLERNNPAHHLEALNARQTLLWQRLKSAFEQQLELRRHQVAEASHALNTVSPLATLTRGYAVVQRHDDHSLITSYRDVKPGDLLEARLATGRLICQTIATFGPEGGGVT